MNLQITRDSPLKAINQGLKPEEIVGRPDRRAGIEVSADASSPDRDRSVREGRVSPATLIAGRCPDRESADRGMGR